MEPPTSRREPLFLFKSNFGRMKRGSIKMYITPLRHGRMRKWLNLDSTRGATVREGRVSVG